MKYIPVPARSLRIDCSERRALSAMRRQQATSFMNQDRPANEPGGLDWRPEHGGSGGPPPYQREGGRLVSASPRFSWSMPLPNRPLQQSAQKVVKSAPKRKGPGGRLSPRDLAAPARFFEGFAKSRPPRTMTRKAQASSAQPAATKVLAWSYGRSSVGGT